MNKSPVKEVADTKTEMLERYRRAEYLMQGSQGTKKLALNTMVVPRWIENTDCFWYVRETAVGKVYQLVCAQTQSNKPAFDHQALANALGKLVKKAMNPDDLPIDIIEIALSPRTVKFKAYGAVWEYCDNTKTCVGQETPSMENAILSPDGSVAVFSRDYNLWIYDLTTGEEKPLTHNGEQGFVYGKVGGGLTDIFPVLDILWSPDSTQLFTQLIDTRELNEWPPVIQYVPDGEQTRPKALYTERRRSYLGDELVESWQLVTINVDTGQINSVDFKPVPVYYPFYYGYFQAGSAWWSEDSQYAFFIYQDVEGKNTQLLKLDSLTGAISTVFEHCPDQPIALFPVAHGKLPTFPLLATNELIWYSDCSGWPHFYLYDLATGQLKHPITQGDWSVRNLLHYDSEHRQLYIQTSGRNPDRNPYYTDICRVNIDTGELFEILSSNHDYLVFDKTSGITALDENANGVSPSSHYIVVSRSRVDTPAESLLLDSSGQVLSCLETADISALPDNWQWPEPVMVKSADGKTDIYGIVFRPTDFSEEREYPVLDYSSGHPEPLRSFSSIAGPEGYLAAQAWAELGFIVVKFNNRGGDLRGNAFRNDRNPDLPKQGKEDCVAGITQLARRYSYLDTTRVGVVDSSYYPTALTGLLIYPDVYKVGVSVHPADARFMGTMYRGWQGYPSYEAFVDNLQGKLLFAHGMLDDIIPVAGTFRIVEALQKANKDFDMLLLPNVGYFGSDYVLRRSWDYLVTHLLERSPPDNFLLNTVGE